MGIFAPCALTDNVLSEVFSELPYSHIADMDIVTAQLNLNWSWSETLKWVGTHPPPTHQELLRHFQAT